MARVNVFGKPIVYDVGATIVNDKRIPAEAVVEGNDLSRLTKEQAAQFAADETRDNKFSIDAGQKDATLSASPANNERFSDDETLLNSYSNSSLSTGVGDIGFFKKGKAPGNNPDGHDLLPSVEAPNDTKIVPKYTSVVLSKNRFTSERKRNGTEQFRVNPDHPEDTLGSWEGYRQSASGKDFSDGDVAHVGTLLTLRATRELGARDAYGRDGPDGAGASLSAILPGGAQAGLLKVDLNDLSVTDVLSSIIDADVESANLDASKALSKHQVLSINAESYGQMNNVLEPFSGLLPLGMIGLSTALVLALKIALKAVLAVFLLITSASKSGSRRTDTLGRYFLGNYNLSAGFDVKAFPPIPLPASLFGLRETVHPFGECVDAGVETFFGSGVGTSFARILETPGFYAVFCRSIVLSAATITDGIKDVVKGNPVQVAQNVIGLIDLIKSSKIVSAMNMFASIGDAALNQKDNESAFAADSDRRTLSVIDALDDASSTGHKNRLYGSLRLAWGVGQSQSAYLLPASLQGSLAAFSQLAKPVHNPALAGLIKNRVSAQKALGNPDIHALDRSVVEETEAALDAEYMPFYFHDLRTNEIIAFPAFLTALNDNYSVNWDSSEGYGRVDAVKTYRSTTRKLTLGFIIASTSLEDFDQMWFKINKLVTLAYPQWSEGTLLKNKDAQLTFTQPFSQVPAASPVIRIRLGDLFRSNYSRFALARLFGFGKTDRFSVPGLGDVNLSPEALKQLEQESSNFFDTSKPLVQDVVYDAYPAVYEEAEEGSALGGALGAAGAALASTVGLGGSSKPKLRKDIVSVTTCKVKKVIDNETYHIVFIDDKQKELFKGKKFVAHRPQLAINASSLLKKLNVSITDGQISAIDDFFNPKNNAIVRSFESVAGKGLACTIDSMDFTWLDNFTWETQVYGARAPKTCRVQLNLSPIHDLAPGIDSDGFNRAPVYNVGRAVNSFGGDSYDEKGAGKTSFNRKQSFMTEKLTRK